MTNKFRRSMASVLLAASLLFSSQSVVAFADYGSKSDASDLSPVQESVENATEEQQEDPSLSVEPVIVESTEAPVAAPMMARANAPVAYSAPEVSGYSLYRYYDYFNEPEPDTVSVYITDGVENYGTVYESAYEIGRFDAFTSGSSWQSYTIDANSFKNNDWIFKGWSYKLTQNNDNHDLGNITDNAVGRRYTFGDGRNSVDAWCHQYNGGETISIHALWRTGLLGSHIEKKSTLHHSIYANFNPLVTVDVGENGKVTYNDGTVVDKDIADKKVEVEYGTAPDFTITPDTGYKVASVTFGDTTIQAKEDGTYTLPPVTEPTTLNVEFEKAEENIDVEDLGLGVKFECTDNDSHNSENIMLKVADKNTYYTISPVDGTTATVTIDANKYLENYNTTNPNHRLVSPSEEYKIQLTLVNNTWTVDEGSTTIVTIPVTCKAEVKQIEHIEINLGENLKKELKVDPLYLHAEYDGKYIFLTGRNGYFTTPTGIEDLPSWVIDLFKGGPIPESLTTDVNDATKAKEFFNGFTFIEWNLVRKQNISFEYIYDVKVDGTTLYITLETPTTEVPEVKPDSFDNIPVAFVCENEKVQHEEGTVLKTISLKESGLSYTYDENEVETGALTLHFDENPIEDYLSLVGKYTSGHVYTYDDFSIDLQYDEATKTWYAPSETEGQQGSYKIYVTCDEDIPDKPTVEDIRDELKVVLDCITEQNHHDSKTYALLETDAFEIVGPYVAPMPLSYEGNMTTPHYFAQVRVKTNSLLEDYNTDHTAHTYAANNPDAIFVLAGNPAPRSTEYMWDLLGEDTIVLKVQHTNPTDPTDPTDPGTNPGGNGGDNDDDDDRYTGGNTVTRTINDDDVPLNDRPTNTTTIDDEDVPLADLPDDTVTIDDGEVPLKANPSTGDSLPFAAMAAAVLSLGGVIVLNRKKK